MSTDIFADVVVDAPPGLVASSREIVTVPSGGPGASGGPTVVRKSSDETVTGSTTLQDDDELTFAIGANETWAVEVHLYLRASTAFDGNVKFATSAPAGATGRHSVTGLDPSNGGGATTGTVKNQSFGGLSTALSVGVAASGSADSYALYTASVVNDSTPGDVTVQWAQLNASGTTTVLAGSFLVAYQIV